MTYKLELIRIAAWCFFLSIILSLRKLYFAFHSPQKVYFQKHFRICVRPQKYKYKAQCCGEERICCVSLKLHFFLLFTSTLRVCESFFFALLCGFCLGKKKQYFFFILFLLLAHSQPTINTLFLSPSISFANFFLPHTQIYSKVKPKQYIYCATVIKRGTLLKKEFIVYTTESVM